MFINERVYCEPRREPGPNNLLMYRWRFRFIPKGAPHASRQANKWLTAKFTPRPTRMTNEFWFIFKTAFHAVLHRTINRSICHFAINYSQLRFFGTSAGSVERDRWQMVGSVVKIQSNPTLFLSIQKTFLGLIWLSSK